MRVPLGEYPKFGTTMYLLHKGYIGQKQVVFFCFFDFSTSPSCASIGHAFSEDSGRAPCRSGWMDIFESLESIDEDMFWYFSHLGWF